jgi:hypothetical protein
MIRGSSSGAMNPFQPVRPSAQDTLTDPSNPRLTGILPMNVQAMCPSAAASTTLFGGPPARLATAIASLTVRA